MAPDQARIEILQRIPWLRTQSQRQLIIGSQTSTACPGIGRNDYSTEAVCLPPFSEWHMGQLVVYAGRSCTYVLYNMVM